MKHSYFINDIAWAILIIVAIFLGYKALPLMIEVYNPVEFENQANVIQEQTTKYQKVENTPDINNTLAENITAPEEQSTIEQPTISEESNNINEVTDIIIETTDDSSTDEPASDAPIIDDIPSAPEPIVEPTPEPTPEPIPEPGLSELQPNIAPNFTQGHELAYNNMIIYADERKIIEDSINEYRVSLGIAPVIFDETLTILASHRASENAWCDWFATGYINGGYHHIRPDGREAMSIFSEYGITNQYTGENLARFFRNPEDVVPAWKNSETHNAILIDSNYTKCGIGVAKDSNGDFYFAASFSN